MTTVLSSSPSFVRASLELAKYIDLAITTPPNHRPFDRADPEIPHYLRFFSSEAIHRARRLIGALKGSTSLKNVTQQEFYNALELLHKGQLASNLPTPPAQQEEVESDWEDEELSQFDLEYFFQQWKQKEEKEDLPEDVIGPLLADPDTHDFAVDILKETIGIRGGSDDGERKKILRSARLRFRAAHTIPFDHVMAPETSEELPDVLDNCNIFCTAVYCLRMHDRVQPASERLKTLRDTGIKGLVVGDVLDKVKHQLKCIRYTDELEHLPGFREASSRRALIYYVRHNKFIDVIMYVPDLSDLQRQIYEGRLFPDRAITYGVAGRQLLTALSNFNVYSTEKLGKYYYPEVPAEFVKLTEVVDILQDVYDLKEYPQLWKYEDIKKATRVAQELINVWKERARNPVNSLFVELDSYDPLLPLEAEA
ncbi:hypothetical protein CPC08DRAFT_771490 [Agrocybe pediades]|nr:hypothetical protein CPC08DRAFT_771490 [Agrocybe pediades]